jgi:hypothetical protein
MEILVFFEQPEPTVGSVKYMVDQSAGSLTCYSWHGRNSKLPPTQYKGSRPFYFLPRPFYFLRVPFIFSPFIFSRPFYFLRVPFIFFYFSSSLLFFLFSFYFPRPFIFPASLLFSPVPFIFSRIQAGGQCPPYKRRSALWSTQIVKTSWPQRRSPEYGGEGTNQPRLDHLNAIALGGDRLLTFEDGWVGFRGKRTSKGEADAAAS